MKRFASILDPRDRIRPRIINWTFASAVFLFAVWLFIYISTPLVPIPLNHSMVDAQEFHPNKVTATVCAKYSCVEAWETDVGTFMSYNSERKAEYVAYMLGDRVRRNGTVLLDFGAEEKSFQQKVDAVNLLFPGKDWF
ncbi:MAG: hypothetical protein ORN27_07835 [Rhodoluna sp.]|nr:hypothetical protein [Rhodoluna sp.]